MSKQYKLEIECLAVVGDGPDDRIFYSKGHHDKEQFVSTLLKEFGFEWSATDVAHDYQRCDVQPKGSEHPYIRNTCMKSERGAYPITAVYYL